MWLPTIATAMIAVAAVLYPSSHGCVHSSSSSSLSSLFLLLFLVEEQDSFDNILRCLRFPYSLIFEQSINCQTHLSFYLILGSSKLRGGHTLSVHKHSFKCHCCTIWCILVVAGDTVVTVVCRGWCPVLLNDGTTEELEGDHFFPPASPSIPRTACSLSLQGPFSTAAVLGVFLTCLLHGAPLSFLSKPFSRHRLPSIYIDTFQMYRDAQPYPPGFFGISCYCEFLCSECIWCLR